MFALRSVLCDHLCPSRNSHRHLFFAHSIRKVYHFITMIAGRGNCGLPPAFKEFTAESSPMELSGERPSDASSIRSVDEWVERQIIHYEGQFTVMEPVSFLFLTYNVASMKPPADMKFVLQQGYGESGNQRLSPDIIVAAMQEVDMSAAALLMEETEASIPWITSLRDAIGVDYERNSDKPYYPLATKQLVGLLLCVFVKKSALPYVRDSQVTTLATGALGAIGNKGCVAVRFVLHMTSICIINAHLAAHQTMVSKRNQDASLILSNCMFNGSAPAATPGNAASAFDVAQRVPQISPKDHDLIFFLGDLNYRVDLSYENAVALASSNQIATLLRCDQLSAELAMPDSPWEGFTDFTPCFPPTYRYDIGTTKTFDTSEKRRIPAYTDRVLFWARDDRHTNVEVLSIGSFQFVCTSDHKPVRVVANVPAKRMVSRLRNEMKASLHASVSKLGLDRVTTAKTAISTFSVDFGVQSYTKHGATRTVRIENLGECVAWVTAYRRAEGDISEASWLRVKPMSMRIFPKQSLDLRVTAVVDKRALRFMENHPPFSGEHEKLLRSLLILTVADGPTHFIECTVKVQPSSFGNTLENIYRFQHLPCRVAYTTASAPEVQHRPQLPKEVWLLVDALYNRGLRQPQLFVEKGSDEEAAAVMDHLDENATAIPEEMASPLSLAQCLVRFLRDLQVSLVPQSMYTVALSAAKQGGNASLLALSSLPPVHANVLVYVLSFLKFVLRPEYASANGLTPEVLGRVFAAVVFPSIERDWSAETTAAQPSAEAHAEASAQRVAAVSFVMSLIQDEKYDVEE